MYKNAMNAYLRGILSARIFTFVFACLITFSLMPNAAYAQSNAHILTLEDPKSSYILAPYSYIVTDEERLLTPDTLVARHNNNLRGERFDKDVVSPGIESAPTWILFTIYNTSKVDNWVIHFGDVLDGRMGQVREIHIMNHSTKQSVSYPASDEQRGASPFLGVALPVKLAPGTKSTFVLYVEAANGLPLVLAPKIMSQTAYMELMFHGDAKTIFSALLFLSAIIFFMTSFYIGRNPASIALLSYYAVLCALFFNMNTNMMSDALTGGKFLFSLYMSSFIPLIIATKFFTKITYDEKPMENMALVALAISVVTICVLYLTIFGLSTSGLIALSATICVTFLSIIVIVLFTSGKPKPITIIYCVALLFAPASLIILTLSVLGFIPMNSTVINLFWLLHIPEALLFIASYLRSNTYRVQRKEQERLQKQYDDQSVSRLQKSKESADQARLLRVIERERELMRELREREVKRTEEMSKAKHAADKANQAKSAFLAVVSHEIRTPMNGILGMVQLLQDTSINQKQQDYIDTIHKSGETMMALLNDILDFEKIESGSMELEEVGFDLRQLANDVVILMSGHAAQKSLTLSADIADSVPQYVMGDPTRLRQVLLNLVNNAIKFTEAGSIKIRIHPSAQHNDKVYMGVVDTGIGIAQSAQKKLFTPFKQAETSTSRKYGGTGLGLAISNRLIEAMNGKIQVESEEGKGSTFWFEIKMQEQKDTPDENTEQRSHGQGMRKETRPMHILVVEDNEMNRKVLEGLLSRDGHTLHMAANGLEAIDICKSNKDLELILMDIQMDGLSGIETTQKIRAESDRDIASTPIVALTGNVMLDDIEGFFEIGMNGFIAKPIDSKKLQEVIHNASLGKFENDLPDGFFEQEQDNDFDYKAISQGLELDDREVFVSDDEIQASKANKEEQHAADQAPALSDIKTPLAFEEDKQTPLPIDKSADEATPIPEKISEQVNKAPVRTMSPRKAEELTEIQKYLLQQHSSQPVDETAGTEAVSAEHPPISQVQTPISDTSEETPPVFSESDNTQTDTAETLPEEQPSGGPEELLDIEMIESLMNTLGREQFLSLIDGFADKASEIIADMHAAITEGNIPSLGARAHELKGMAGNFGMRYVSEIAGEVEKLAKISQGKEATTAAQKLNAANDQTKVALEQWINK